jgi:hypothetical protein
MNTAYASITDGTITGPSASAIAVQDTALNFTNKGNISIISSVTVANGNEWTFGAAPAQNVFMVEASIDGGTNFLATKLSGGALTLNATQAYNANCDLALRITTPTSVTTTAKLTSAQVVTILSTQN